MPPVSATGADLFGAVAIIAVSAAMVLGPRAKDKLGPHPSAADCDELLAKYTELKERSVTSKLDSKRYAEALSEARREAGPSFSACTAEVTLEELECARRADDVDKLERCLR